MEESEVSQTDKLQNELKMLTNFNLNYSLIQHDIYLLKDSINLVQTQIFPEHVLCFYCFKRTKFLT